MITEIGPVPLEVPRDRDGSFEPRLVRKRQRRLAGVDELVISLTAKGLTTGEVRACQTPIGRARFQIDERTGAVRERRAAGHRRVSARATSTKCDYALSKMWLRPSWKGPRITSGLDGGTMAGPDAPAIGEPSHKPEEP